MLSSILRSERAEKVNIVIIDTFVKLRELMCTHKENLDKMKEIEQHVSSHDYQRVMLFEHLKKILEERELKEEHESRKRIGLQYC